MKVIVNGEWVEVKNGLMSYSRMMFFSGAIPGWPVRRMIRR